MHTNKYSAINICVVLIYACYKYNYSAINICVVLIYACYKYNYSAINICVVLTNFIYASPDRIIKLRTNFSRAKLIVKRMFLTIQSQI